MKPLHQASEALVALINRALEHGIASIEEGAGPLIPFVLTQSKDQGINCTRLVIADYEEAVARARTFVREIDSRVLRYAMAFDGYVPTDGAQVDAVLVEAGERGGGVGVAYAQCYRPFLAPSTPLERIGGPRLLRAVPNLLDAPPLEDRHVVVVCPGCGGHSRLSLARLTRRDDPPRCSACGSELVESEG